MGASPTYIGIVFAVTASVAIGSVFCHSLSEILLILFVAISNAFTSKLMPNLWDTIDPKIALGLRLLPFLALRLYFGICCLSIAIAAILALIWRDLDYAERLAITLPRDFQGFRILARVQGEIRPRLKANAPLHEIFSKEIVARYPRKPAFIDCETGLAMSFSDLDAYSNQVANYFHEKGFKEGDCIALYMHNCPEYAGIWLGLSKIGVITALINFNLRLEQLSHSIDGAQAKAIIAGADLQTAIEDAINNSHIESGTAMPLFINGEVAPSLQGVNLGEELKSASKLSPTVKTSTNMKSTLFYIYTSGTTGLPKPAVIKHARFFFMSRGTHIAFGMRPTDRLYITMPMYHSAAGILGVGQTLLSGCTSVVRKKFSASRFWEETIQYDCTLSQYIGEICRYLLSQPVKDIEKKHKIRMMFGNGLRPQIWSEFCERFGIEKIGEFYGSTEGNSNILNTDNHQGACGFFPLYRIAALLYPIGLVKVDKETGEVCRNKKGLCLPCGPEESGEMVAKIISGDPLKDFHGYANKGETAKKIIKDVYSKGDRAFTSGDILYMDRLGYLFFKDRTGDTFRWKGENVSTAEVEAVISKIIGLNDATVYGVDIPGTDGKAGMAAIVDVNENIDLEELRVQFRGHLAAYARPVFIRLCKEVDMTGTYKLVKTELRKNSYNPAKGKPSDKVYYMNGKSGDYELVTPDIFEQIESGKIKF